MSDRYESARKTLMNALNHPVVNELECVVVAARTKDGEIIRWAGGQGMTDERMVYLAHTIIRWADEEAAKGNEPI